jgi:nucleoside phosphorylase/tetratricopeptide (TPR) repeat protein
VQADVLIVTVTKVESKAVREVFEKATGQPAKNLPIGAKMYRDLGSVNSTRVFMVRSEMGAGGLGAAQQTVAKGIADLSPSAVIMVGIAFGVDDKKQAIGDVLVSQGLMLYDLQRVGTGDDGSANIISRGDRPPASAWLVDRLRNADEDWREPRASVRFGRILSGEKLVDNIDFRGQLRKFEPEAIGGEMEGAGLYSACQESKTDWILVKGICDWADGKKAENRDERQKLAAQNAASFVLHALQQAPLRRETESFRRHLLPAPLGYATEVYGPATRQKSRSTLPQQPYFFGREKELAIIADALAPESRSWGALIDGPGGIGKTALAIRAAYLAPDEHFSDKIFLSAKKRELTPSGEKPLEDFMLPNYLSLLTELAKELGEDELSRTKPNERANEVRRALADKNALIIIDNVESFEEPEQVRLYQFLSRLPGTCKAIVTSRRRSDIDARVIRLDRLLLKEALDLMAELAKTNKYLAKSSQKEWRDLYEITQGNPLLIKWAVGQLGRQGSQCRTIAEAYKFLQSAPKDNDPLEYIFGDLVDTFSESETAALAALVHFTQPAKVEWIAQLARLGPQAAQTALEDLTDRALLVSDERSHTFFLPPLTATFLRRTRPEAVATTAGRLADRAHALAMEHGHKKFEAFQNLEAEWPTISAALLIILNGENERLQSLCDALHSFLNFSGRWDEWLFLSDQAEKKALAVSDFYHAGWRASEVGWAYHLRRQSAGTLECAARCESHWRKAGAGARERALALSLRGNGYQLARNYPAAIAAYREALELDRALAPESMDVAADLNALASVELNADDYAASKRDFREALRIARRHKDREGIANYTGNLAEWALSRQDWLGAEALARKALKAAEGVGRIELIASDCRRVAVALARQGRNRDGLPFARRAFEIATKLGQLDDIKRAEAALKECEDGTCSQSRA